MKPPALSITYSLADQNFAKTKTIGTLNLSVQLAEELAKRPEVDRFKVLSNPSLRDYLKTSSRMAVEEHASPIGGAAKRMIWDQWGVYTAARRAGNDWLFLPKGYASFARRSPVKLACYLGDVMHEYYARHYPKAIPWLENLYFKTSFIGSLRHADVIFTNSEFTRTEILRVAREWGLTPPPIFRGGIGFYKPECRAIAKQNRIIALAGKFPHKRTDLAVKYLTEWQRREHYAGEIHWIGGFPEGVTLPDFPNWKRHQRLPESDYRDLLASAKALVYFSEYEGFGMPPVEAALAGVCPVYSDLPPTREVMGATGKAFQNEDFDSFALALNEALATPLETVEVWGEELLARHNWAAVGERVIKGLLETEGN